MEARKCDRCGNYYDKKTSGSFPYLISKRRDTGRATILDLCGKCEKNFMSWIGSIDESPTIIEQPKSYKTFDKNTKLADAIDVEKLLTLVWPENLNHRTRLRNVLKGKTLAYIYLEENPEGIGKETWKKVKDYILTSKEVWR